MKKMSHVCSTVDPRPPSQQIVVVINLQQIRLCRDRRWTLQPASCPTEASWTPCRCWPQSGHRGRRCTGRRFLEPRCLTSPGSPPPGIPWLLPCTPKPSSELAGSDGVCCVDDVSGWPESSGLRDLRDRSRSPFHFRVQTSSQWETICPAKPQ